MKKWLVGILAFSFFVGVVLHISKHRITKNFYEVDPRKFYRSAQLTSSELLDVIRQYGIKTVISVRGQPIAEEVNILKKNHIKLRAFRLDADYFPEKKDLNQILNLYRFAPKPILIHCRAGADRTGEMSALYVLEEMHQSKDVALEQLSFKYWHVRAFHPAMSEFIRLYQGRNWAQFSYDPCHYPNYKEHLSECLKK